MAELIVYGFVVLCLVIMIHGKWRTTKKWLTNIYQDDSCSWCCFKTKEKGRPKASYVYNVEELESMGYVGLYAKKGETTRWLKSIIHSVSKHGVCIFQEIQNRLS